MVRTRRYRSAALVLAVTGAVGVCLSWQPASADSAVPLAKAAPQDTGNEVVETETDRAARSIKAVIDETKWSEYGNAVIDESAASVTLYSTSSPPPAVQAAIDAVNPTVHVILKRSTYRLLDLAKETQRIGATFRSGPYQVEGVGMSSDASSLWVAPTDKANVSGDDAKMKFLNVVSPNLRAVARQPDGMRSTNLRNDPYPPVWGSALMHSNTTNACGTGFVVFNGSAPNRTYGVITALHCGQALYYGRANNSPAGAFLGRTHAINSSLDAQWLTSADSYGRAVWRGSWNSSTGYEVAQVPNPFDGETVCMSGSFSGQICGTASDPYSMSNGIYPGFRMYKGTSCAVRAGDSGSAVYTVQDNYRVYIKGMEDQGGGPIPSGGCPGNPYGNTPQNQFTIMFAVYSQQIMSAFGVAPATVANSAVTN